LDSELSNSLVKSAPAPVEVFASEAAALGAQREANLRKLILKKMPVEFDDAEPWLCEAVFDDAPSTYLFAEQVDGEWLACPRVP
jgi:hypothetical protein